jgi:hypothetical protein
VRERQSGCVEWFRTNQVPYDQDKAERHAKNVFSPFFFFFKRGKNTTQTAKNHGQTAKNHGRKPNSSHMLDFRLLNGCRAACGFLFDNVAFFSTRISRVFSGVCESRCVRISHGDVNLDRHNFNYRDKIWAHGQSHEYTKSKYPFTDNSNIPQSETRSTERERGCTE